MKLLFFALCSFLIKFLVQGQLSSFAFLFSLLNEKFSLTLLQAALIGTIEIGLFFATWALWVTFLPGMLQGTHTKTLLGTFFWSMGIFGTAMSSNYLQLICTLGVLTGIGSSLLYWSAYVSLVDILSSKKDNWRYFLLVVVSLSGTCGDIFFAMFVSQYYSSTPVNDNLEQWQMVYLIQGAIGAVVFTGCGLYFKLFNKPEKIANHFLQVKNAKNFKTSGIFVSFLLSVTLTNFAVPVVMLFLVPYMKELNLGSQAGLSSSLGSLGGITGGMITGGIITIIRRSDGPEFNFGVAYLYCVAMALNGGITFTWLACKDKNSIFTFSFFNGFMVSGTLTILVALNREFQKLRQFKREEVSSLLVPVIIFGIVPGSIFAGMIAGILRQNTGSYTLSIVVAGIFQVLAWCASVATVILIKMPHNISSQIL